MSGRPEPYCSHLDGYSVVTFPKELNKAPLNDIREAGEKVVSELAELKSPQCLIDITALDIISSSLVASIVRIWKTIDANQGRMVVAASTSGAREVLRITGLSRVWTVRSSYEAALHELGFSVQAKVVKRELRLLALVGPATLLVGGVATALGRVPQLSALSKPSDWVAYALIGMAVITAGVSVFREHSWRRWLSVFVFLVAAPLFGWLVWTAPATSTVGAEKDASTSSQTETAESDASDGSEMPESEVPSHVGSPEETPSSAPSTTPPTVVPSTPDAGPTSKAERIPKALSPIEE